MLFVNYRSGTIAIKLCWVYVVKEHEKSGQESVTFFLSHHFLPRYNTYNSTFNNYVVNFDILIFLKKEALLRKTNCSS